MTMVEMRFDSLKKSKPHEYAVRFFFGGLCTVLAALVAKRFGPGVGGLFLAFPAIFPAGASLIDKHEQERKKKAGFDGQRRGKVAASVDAAGASLGAIGLVGFAVVLWLALERWNAGFILFCAAGAWAALAFGSWAMRKSRLIRPLGTWHADPFH